MNWLLITMIVWSVVSLVFIIIGTKDKNENYIGFGAISLSLSIVVGWLLVGFSYVVSHDISHIKASVLYEPNGEAAYVVSHGNCMIVVTNLQDFKKLNDATNVSVTVDKPLNMYGHLISQSPDYSLD